MLHQMFALLYIVHDLTKARTRIFFYLLRDAWMLIICYICNNLSPTSEP